MILKSAEREKAIILREQGLTYNEILKEVFVAKSTLSLWLRSVGLSKVQKQVMTQKRRDAQLRGAAARHRKRIDVTKQIQDAAIADVGTLSMRELWLIGVALYWAEGSKEKDGHPGSGVDFTNSDPQMIRLFIRWLTVCCGIRDDDIYLTLYIHENHKHRVEEVKKFWIKQIQLPRQSLKYVYFKKHRPKTNRKNTGENYQGILVVSVRRSSTLNRKIAGWVQGITKGT